uniref:Serine/threonine-protein kinase-like protein CCR4 n=1 Tax=Rhizophora mucronata TaxID=61149 RepID=A0A2P2QL76_RHIMU
MAFLFSSRVSSLLLFFTFISCTIPFAYSIPTVAISETCDHQTLVCALVRSQRSSLNCSSFPAGIQIPEIPNIPFSGVVAGDGFVCALSSIHLSYSSISTMVCWRFSVNGTNMSRRRIYQGPALRDLKAGNSHICGLVNGTDRLRCWQWPEFNPSIAPTLSSIAVGEEFVCGLLANGGAIRCFGKAVTVKASIAQVPSGNYRVIAAGFRHACVLTCENELDCWGDMMGEKPQGKFISLALGENRSCALRANRTVVCWGQNNFSLPKSLRETYFISIEAKRNIFCGVLARNFCLYCWGNENFDSMLMVFGSAPPGSRRSDCPCGPLTGSGTFCQQGYDVCQHCKYNSNGIPPVATGPSDSTPPLSPPVSRPSPGVSGSRSSNEWSGRMIAFLVMGCNGSLALLLIIGFFIFKYCKFRGCRIHDSGRLEQGTETPPEQGLNPRQNSQEGQTPPAPEQRLFQLASMGKAGQLEEFSLQVLLEATDNFSEDHKIGTGSFGSVYMGILEDGRKVAIKRAEVLSSKSSINYGMYRRQEDKDNAFIHELESLSRLHHKNLVCLIGFCEDSSERVLVYEYMHNGTLHDHLHILQSSPLMSWSARIKVALDAARGVEYLHEYAVPPIIHRDIKPSNILLDHSWIAKMSDFGLSLMGPQDEESHLSLRAAGTVGYMDPEYYRLQQLTTKSDVYSFGVVLLEILSGLKAIHKNENGVPRNVVDFVVPYVVQDEIHRILDKKVPPPTPFEIEAVAYVGYLAADCVTLEGRDRPSMTEIVNSLERALGACLVHPASLSRSTTGSST